MSSTDLLKSLLEEPIKRSWLCRSTCNSSNSTDEQSDFSQKSPHSSEGEQLERFLVSMPGTDKAKSYASNWSAGSQSLSNATLLQKSAKPDLPGRVSFSKPNSSQHNDVDSSDCDNDKQEIRASSSSISISAPGPLTLPNFTYNGNANKLEPGDATGQKKSVHFGTPAAGSGSAEVLAETYEYPKCPSENCTCSTRSSSTASTNEATADIKCACDAPSCRYAETKVQLPPPSLPMALPKSGTPELNVIREYKQVVGVALDKGVKPLEPLNNMELPNYLDKYATQAKDKQNNLSEKNLSPVNGSNNNNNTNHTQSDSGTTNRSAVQRNFGAENNFLPIVQEDRRHFGNSSSDSVISNYLKIAATPPFVGKKKENVKPASAELTSRNNKSKLFAKSSTIGSAAKLKKAVSVGSLREERKLSEYNLDKVDSWMSIHEQKQALAQFEELHKQGVDELDEGNDNESVSQLSLKSNEDSRGSTYDEIVSVIKEIEEDKKRGILEQHFVGLFYFYIYIFCRQLCRTFAQRAEPEAIQLKGRHSGFG